IRRSPRIAATGEVEVLFHRLGRRVRAHLTDKSLHGVGLALAPGFVVHDRDDIVIEAPGPEGRNYPFEAIIQRARPRADGYLCGAEFHAAAGVFPEAVSFLYGDSRNWLAIWESKENSRGTVRILAMLFMRGLVGCLFSTGTIWRRGR